MKRLFDTNSLSLHQFSPRMYCLVSTRSQSVISRLRSIGDERIRFVELPGSSENRLFLFKNPAAPQSEIISTFFINDQGDYDLARISATLLGGGFVDERTYDSLISLACLNDERFACTSGFWGIMTHYWHRSEDTFVCSSNVFLVAGIVGGAFSKESFYEYLFFSWPRRDRTWFKDIQCLLPGQQLIFDLREQRLRLSGTTDFNAFLEPSNRDLIEAFDNFFTQAKHQIGPDATNYISLSAGSDSRTVLSCLRAFDMRPHAVSFGRYDMIETRTIHRLTHRLHIPWLFVDMEGFEEKFEELFVEGTFYSSGFLNPLRTHYVWMYNHIRRGNALFEGILGSEFAKGEIAVPAMAALPYYEVVAKNRHLAESVTAHYSQLPGPFLRDLTDYIQSEYGAELLDVNATEGKRAFQLYLLENIPCKVFAAVILIAKANSLLPYFPFLSPSILRAIFDNDAGVRKSVSVRRDFVGPIESLKAEARVVKHMDEEIFNSVLDRNIRFRDVLASRQVARATKRVRDFREKVTKSRLTSGQIDVSKLIARMPELVRGFDKDILPIGCPTGIENELLTRTCINYSWIHQIAHTLLR